MLDMEDTMDARLLTPLLLLLAACPPLDDKDPDGDPDAFSECATDDGDPITVDAVRVVGDTLEVDVGHGGGCEEHTYQICWPDQSFMESDPVQVDLEVYHDAHGDGCEAYLQSTLEFDLTPLKESYLDGYQATSGEIVIHLDGETVTYTF